MALSADTLKNLLDVMQKVSLAITAVSVALLSIVVSQRSVEKEAQIELARLLRIRANLGTVQSTIDGAITKIDPQSLLTVGHYAHFNAELKTSKGTVLRNVIIEFPRAFYIPTDPDLEKKSFNEANTLDELRQLWNAVAMTTEFWRLGDKPSPTASLLNSRSA